MVYHSSFNDDSHPMACGCVMPPIRGISRADFTSAEAENGGAGNQTDHDVVDEVLYLFRAVVFFRTYDVQGPGDKLLIYLMLFASQCLKKMAGVKNQDEGLKEISTLIADNSFKIPGDSGFILGGLMSKPETPREAEMFRSYLRHAREQLGMRLLRKCFHSDGSPNKFWLAFHHRKFMGKDMNRTNL